MSIHLFLTNCTIHVYRGNNYGDDHGKEKQAFDANSVQSVSNRLDARFVLKMRIIDDASSLLQSQSTSSILVESLVKAWLNCFYTDGERVFLIYPNPGEAQQMIHPNNAVTIYLDDSYRTSKKSGNETESLLCIALDAKENDTLNKFTESGSKGVAISNFDQLYKLYRSRFRSNLVGRSIALDN